MSAPLSLRGEALSKHYPMGGAIFGRRSLVAVDAVDLELVRGRTLALVGESGCGKSTVGRLLLGLLAPTSGRALLGGCDFAAMPRAEWRRLRRHCQMIFQDPAAALNPRRTVREALEEPLAIHEPELAPAAREERIQALRARVGLGAEHLHRFPAGLSGGQRQRLVIARALALDPAFLFADEPVASLDVSVRAQVLNLLVELQRERDLGCLFVSHDLQVVRHLADDIAIMYLGRIVERAEAAAFFARPAHPYARVLLSSLPGAGGRILLEGEVPSPLAPPPGCPFHPRCPVYRGLTAAEQARCRGERPQLLVLRDDGARQVACHFPGAP